jgi:voltage-gated potassium channel
VGQALAAVIMVMGYGIIAVPTGIVTVELHHAREHRPEVCPGCGSADHPGDSQFCRCCGSKLPGGAT